MTKAAKEARTGKAGKRPPKSRPEKTKETRPGRGRGRPSAYQDDYAKQAEKLAVLGLVDREMAAFFEVSERTLNSWKGAHPEFLQALKRGKAEADAQVAHSLFRRAVGFAHPAVKIFADPKTGSEKIVPYVERYPPDTTACIFWLKNRQPELWRDRHNHELTGKDGAPLHPPTKDEAMTSMLDRLAQIAEQGEAGRAAMGGTAAADAG